MFPPKAGALIASILFVSAGGASAGPAVVTATSLNLRAGPGGGYGVLARMPHGASVQTLDCKDEWCRIRYRGLTGYAASGHLDQAGAAASAKDSFATAIPATAFHVRPPDSGARIWRWDDPRSRHRIMRKRQLQRGR